MHMDISDDIDSDDWSLSVDNLTPVAAIQTRLHVPAAAPTFHECPESECVDERDRLEDLKEFQIQLRGLSEFYVCVSCAEIIPFVPEDKVRFRPTMGRRSNGSMTKDIGSYGSIKKVKITSLDDLLRPLKVASKDADSTESLAGSVLVDGHHQDRSQYKLCYHGIYECEYGWEEESNILTGASLSSAACRLD